LSVRDIHKAFPLGGAGFLPVLQGISFDLRRGTILGIVGPSGCGKTTLLNVIAGVEAPTNGEIVLNHLAVRIGYLFQMPSLIPWETVLSNALLGPDLDHVTRSRSIARARELLEFYDLAEFFEAYPNTLSVGMQQRVALVRLLLYGANLLLLDEPFNRVDWSMRQRLYSDVSRLIDAGDVGAILVTHDIDEAAVLCDEILVLGPRPARLIQQLRVTSAREVRLRRHFREHDLVDEVAVAISAAMQTK
jgi:NitT/TauT family transport system ATP-binding protein